MYRVHVTNLNYSSMHRALLIIGGRSSFSMILYFKYNGILFSDGFISSLKGVLFVLRTKESYMTNVQQYVGMLQDSFCGVSN